MDKIIWNVPKLPSNGGETEVDAIEPPLIIFPDSRTIICRLPIAGGTSISSSVMVITNDEESSQNPR